MDDDQSDHPRASRISTRPRSFKDPVHDYMTFTQRVCAFIDTRQFQRLRAIKQLGTSYFIWPGASHNRFEHCLGVAYLARQLANHLKDSQPELGITERDVECVELAGLCHDLGHGPWSHVWDNMFIPLALKGKGKTWKHEQGSEMMFDYLLKDNAIDISAEDGAFIKSLIQGEKLDSEKAFLYEIVANKRNGLDVDKFDYILRDAHMIGDRGNLSLSRLIHSARVIDNQICYDIKDANQIYELCYTRFSLHKRIYNHKTAKAIEYMIIDALLAADPHLHIADQVFQPEKFVHLTDDIMPRVESSDAPELARARSIFDRIRTRDLYRCVDYNFVKWGSQKLCREAITPAAIVKAAQALPDSALTSLGDKVGSGADAFRTAASLTEDIIIVDLSPMHYGMQDKNPMKFIKFYSKTAPDQCSYAGRGDISSLMPECFGEVLLRVYTRDSQYYGIVQAGYRAVLATMPEDALVLNPPEEEKFSPATPPAAPATPPPGGQKKRGFTRSFSGNIFTTVAPSFAPESPTQIHKKPKSKRGRDADVSPDAALRSPPKKKRG